MESVIRKPKKIYAKKDQNRLNKRLDLDDLSFEETNVFESDKPSSPVGCNMDLDNTPQSTSKKSVAMANLATTASRTKTLNRKSHVKTLVDTLHIQNPEELLEHKEFVDAPLSKQICNVKEIKTTLHAKKKFLEHLHSVDTKKKRRPGCCKQIIWNLSMVLSNFWQHVKELRYSIELWSNHIKMIEGHFGSGVTSYFTFLRSLFYLNITVMTVLVFFLTVPQVLYRFLQQEPPGYSVNGVFSGLELLTGQGWFNYSELYYGYHHDNEILVLGSLVYDMRYAYILANTAYYVITVVLLATFLSISYRTHYIQESSANHHHVIVKVFCGWNYKISDNALAVMQQNLIWTDLQLYLLKFKDETESLTCRQKTSIYLLRIFLNVLVLGILGGAGYCVWYISDANLIKNDIEILQDLAMPLCITGFNVIIPFFFTLIGRLEHYSMQQVKLILNMIRTLTLYLVTLGVMVHFLYTSVDCRLRYPEDLDISNSTTGENETSPEACDDCWENFMGQQIYTLVIMDFVLMILITLITELGQRLVNKVAHKDKPLPTFNIARNILSLVYSQILVWMGAFYSPLLPVIQTLKLIIIFYIKRLSVVHNCRPPSKNWTVGQTSTVVQFLLFVSFMTSFIAVAYGVIFLPPSEMCGPFKHQNTSFEVLAVLLVNWETSGIGDTVKPVIEVVTSLAFFAAILIGLVVAAYYCSVVAHAHSENVKKLRNQIMLEGRDRQFLLKLLHRAQDELGREPITDDKTLYNKERSRKRKHDNTNENACPTSLKTQQNDSYVDLSVVEPDRGTSEAASEVRYRLTGQPQEAKNPGYRDESPTRLPALPYHTPKYEV